MNCLQGFTLELNRDKHYAYCIDNETVRVEGYQALAIWLVHLQQIANGDIKDLLKFIEVEIV